MKVRTKLTVVNNIAVAAVIVGFSLFLFFQVRSVILENIEHDLERANHQIVDLIESASDASIKVHLRTISETARALVEYQYERYLNGELSEAEAYAAAKAIMLDPDYGKIGDTGYLAGVGTDGVLVIHPKSEGVDASGFEFMQRAMSMKNGYLEYMWKNQGEETERAKAGWLSYFEPWDFMVWASSYKSEFADLVEPDDFRDTVLDIDLGESGYPYIIDSDGNVIIHPFEAGTNMYMETDADGQLFIQEICREKEGEIEYRWRNEGEAAAREKVARYSYIEPLDWIVVTTYYREDIYRTLTQFQRYFIVFVAATFIIVFLLNYWIGSSLMRHLGEDPAVIQGVVEQVASGDLDVSANGKQPKRGVYLSVSQMVDALRQKATIIDQIAHRDLSVDVPKASDRDSLGESLMTMREALNDLLLQVESAVDMVHGEAEELSESSREMSEGASEQAGSLEEIASSMEELHAQSRQNAESATEANEVAQTAAHAAQQGRDRVHKLRESMDEAERYSGEIVQVVKTVDDIAFQINLLSLNANIEAARAGKYGQGFAVVADEVRNLAQRSADAAKQTGEIVQRSVASIGNGSKGVTDTADTLETIAQAAGEVAGHLRQITEAGAEQAEAIERVTGEIGRIDTITQATAADAEKRANIARELAAGTATLRSTVGQFNLVRTVPAAE